MREQAQGPSGLLARWEMRALVTAVGMTIRFIEALSDGSQD